MKIMHNFSIKGYDRPTWIYCHYSIFFIFFLVYSTLFAFRNFFLNSLSTLFHHDKKIKNIIINLLKKDVTEKRKEENTLCQFTSKTFTRQTHR